MLDKDIVFRKYFILKHFIDTKCILYLVSAFWVPENMFVLVENLDCSGYVSIRNNGRNKTTLLHESIF